jgi:hypothetical protein
VVRVELKRQGRKLKLEVDLNKPAEISVQWGKAWPLEHSAHSKGKPKTQHSLVLNGAGPGPWLLLQVRASSPKAGEAVARTRWIKLPQ